MSIFRWGIVSLIAFGRKVKCTAILYVMRYLFRSDYLASVRFLQHSIPHELTNIVNCQSELNSLKSSIRRH